jgi:hypothetical protein
VASIPFIIRRSADGTRECGETVQSVCARLLFVCSRVQATDTRRLEA